ncbi:MBL fold metallo-hydrolase [Anaeromyxobacter paludicola]|uniref:cAMP phosphodiesterase class-II:metallo-beta-lactamase superfamily protein n=1 Tax=Anaeromyxobacter paludicola TaxID=2918171 RepID=A0ABN6N7U3_9BACT|nr:3',5'-cyclic-nucleotide phosphodiesterase [Anaeromyxobacter paludicola]BDG08099.1 cAMP phosphodiesterase class-II:metallo-beta-lactamase superfamily protein [Anaeromyxobacter paludicola]
MIVDVLGASGGELPGHRTTSFLLDGVLAVDAGALTASLPLEALLRVEDVVLTHSHLDHVKDVPLLADLLTGRRDRPLRVHASTACAATLRDSVFNDRLWPDFTRIPSPDRPTVELRPFEPSRPFQVGRYRVEPVPVTHSVDCVGLIVSDGAAALAVSGDTGPTERFWERVSAAERLSALFVELSFPSALQWLADLSGHLTPRTLQAELRKISRPAVPVYLYHLKPAHQAELERELQTLGLDGVTILRAGDRLNL